MKSERLKKSYLRSLFFRFFNQFLCHLLVYSFVVHDASLTLLEHSSPFEKKKNIVLVVNKIHRNTQKYTCLLFLAEFEFFTVLALSPSSQEREEA